MTTSQTAQKIDIFTHILLPKFKEALDKKAKPTIYQELNRIAPALSDLDARFKMMDKYEGVKQILTIASPPVEMVFDVATATEVSKMANDEVAELVAKYPDRFAGAVACLPMNNHVFYWRIPTRAGIRNRSALKHYSQGIHIIQNRRYGSRII